MKKKEAKDDGNEERGMDHHQQVEDGKKNTCEPMTGLGVLCRLRSQPVAEGSEATEGKAKRPRVAKLAHKPGTIRHRLAFESEQGMKFTSRRRWPRRPVDRSLHKPTRALP